MTARIPIAVIKGGLQGRIEQLVRELVPGGKRVSNLWEGKNPTRADRSAGSFKVWLRGNAVGSWKDYATDDKGDVLDLIRYVRGGDRGDAIRWAQDWLGLATVDAATLERMRDDAARRRAERERDTRSRDEARVRRAFRMWQAASPEILGTPVDRYLAGPRGIPLREVPNLEWGEIRYAKRLEWWKGATWHGDRRIPGPSFPAMVCAVRQATGEITAVHCTFLAPDGSGKADVPLPKLMFGLVTGGVIRLTRGPDDATPEKAKALGLVCPLVIGEGPEDGLTLGWAIPEARAWAATSLSNLAHVPVDHPCVSRVVVARDNDWSQPQAMAAFERAMDALAERGPPVAAMSAPGGAKDFNDLVRRDSP